MSHFIFGRLIFGRVKLPHMNNMVKGLSLIEKTERICEGCIFGKQHRESFLVGRSYRACTPLDIVHSNIGGCVNTIHRRLQLFSHIY